jgi:hypothetical protein
MVARGPEQRCVLTNTAVGDGSTRQVSGPRSTADDDWRRSDKCPAWVMKQKINRVGGNQPCEYFRVESEESKVEEFQAEGTNMRHHPVLTLLRTSECNSTCYT